ncbi:hypothetical protein GUJ93_ZPchr0001g31725 [Zizania palustris]|uniref:Uncharacterized protein n=1 Tax=Zizania palustris TaxID=103762 RepID=A0A8J5RS08_ZIZPA|nr:hypothetical protein GUJ93_ZPchr0001g31725 [Zizania palustris]
MRIQLDYLKCKGYEGLAVWRPSVYDAKGQSGVFAVRCEGGNDRKLSQALSAKGSTRLHVLGAKDSRKKPSN